MDDLPVPDRPEVHLLYITEDARETINVSFQPPNYVVLQATRDGMGWLATVLKDLVFRDDASEPAYIDGSSHGFEGEIVFELDEELEERPTSDC